MAKRVLEASDGVAASETGTVTKLTGALPVPPELVSPPLPLPHERDPKASYPHPNRLVHGSMTMTLELPVAERWQKAGAKLVSVSRIDPANPYSPQRYVFRETVTEIAALIETAVQNKVLKEEQVT